MFKKAFNLEKSGNKIIDVINSIIEPEIDINIGKPIKFAKRTIYPVVQTSVIKNERRESIAAEIFPIALLIEEPQGEYVISLNGDEISSKEIRKIIYPEKE
ncbi:MAG: hypothetical protein PQ971_02865 [Methanobacterium sp.]